MTIPTQPIGSIPRPLALIEATRALNAGKVSQDSVDALYQEAIRDTIERFEATGSPVITDGEQKKYDNFATYSIYGLPNLAPDGFKLQFAAGHHRQFPRLTAGPFRYKRYADGFLDEALKYARVPVKQAVISPSALSLLYPAEAIPDYSRDMFIEDLLREHETEVRNCLAKGAHLVQIDFTEGRLAVKIDPSGQLLNSFIQLNNLALDRFSAQERQRIGVHTCPGADCDSTHSAEVDYAELLPGLFELKAGNFFIALAREPDRERVLKMIGRHLKPQQRAFIGVIDVMSGCVESPEEVRDLILLAAQYIPLNQLGTTDDCGYSPFSDDTSTSRDLAFEKIRARVEGTALACRVLRSREN
jgi:5-methyltetrahydropteroyltriglutamate--homocysteine methyltransferase